MKRFLFLALLTGYLASFAQSGLMIRADYELSSLTGDDINDFFDSYNAYYGTNMVREFEDIPVNAFNHINWGGGIRLLGLSNEKKKVDLSTGLFVTYGSGNWSQDGEFRNGIITQTDFVTRDYTLQYDLGILLFNRLSLTGFIGGRFRTTILDVGYFY